MLLLPKIQRKVEQLFTETVLSALNIRRATVPGDVAVTSLINRSLRPILTVVRFVELGYLHPTNKAALTELLACSCYNPPPLEFG